MRGIALLALIGCGAAEPQSTPCAGSDALLDCSARTMDDAHYVAQAHAYFDSMDTEPVGTIEPSYTETTARWEWPPWLLLTGFGGADIHASDALLAAYPSTVRERDCRAFEEPPFARCRVVFYYEAHDGRPCPIYEEFAFNEAGEVTWIEAWTDDPAYNWGEADEVGRLSARVPGLGTVDGLIDPTSAAMEKAASTDPDLADFAERAQDWQAAWIELVAQTDDDAMWSVGCGWQ